MRRYWKIFVLIAVLSAAAAGLTFLLIKKAYDSKHSTGKAAQQAGTEAGLFAVSKETLNLWYTDDSLTDYLNSVAVAYNAGSDKVRVTPKLVSGKDYIKAISDASVKNEDMPDLYLISNDTLEQASLAGLTSEVNKKDSAEFSAKDPATAVNAVTYKGKIVGYPVYYETGSLLYNKTYLDDWAKAQIEAAQSETADTSVQGTTASSGDADQKEIDAEVAKALPKTIADIETFADTYDAPDDMQAIFKWDVNDIFYNYFFIGSSVDVGGKCGDDGTINIYNSNSIKSLMQYQKLNQFFSIDTSEISYDGVLQDFIDGKILYTVATTDALKKIDEAKKEGKCSYDYGMTLLPSINSDLPAKSMSVTTAAVINGYCADKDSAAGFAKYLAERPAQELYDRTGKVSVQKDAQYRDACLSCFMKEYERSAPVPKMISTANYWVKLEIAFAGIWDGADPNDTLHTLSEEMLSQAGGSKVTQDKIEVEETAESTDATNEYVDDSTGTGSTAAAESTTGGK